MSNSPGLPESSKSNHPQGNYDPSILLSSLYGMNAAFGGGNPLASALAGLYSSNSSTSPTHSPSTMNTIAVPSSNSSTTDSTTLGVAASQAASLGINQANAAWYAMAQQLAAQDYLARLQAANPTYAAAAAAALAAAQRSSQNSAALNSFRLPSDTELIKQHTSPSSKPSGASNRGRKKTISLDPAAAASAAAANMFLNNLNALNSATSGQSTPSSTPSRGSTPTIPSGLTIERKKSQKGTAGAHSDNYSAPPIVDRVEITKVPISNGGSKSQDDAPLNLSLKTSSIIGNHYPSNKSPSNKIPTDYYASQALSGAFLAEQIRQSQLAAALESRLESNSSHPQLPLSTPAAAAAANLQNIQAALLMNKLKAGAAAASANNSIINNNNNTPSNKQGGGKNSSSRSNKKTSNLTVASLLSKHRNGNNHNYHSNHPALSSHHSFASQEEVEKAEKSVSANPELTIEPIYKPTRLSGSASGNSSNKEWKKSSQSDDSKNSTTHNEPQSQVPSSQDYSEKDDECGVEDDGKLKIKNVNESPEIRNLSDQDTDEEESECGNDVGGSSSTSSSLPSVKNNNSRMSDLRLPLDLGWKRESLVREYSKSGFRGDIFYYAPCGKKFKQYSDILRYLEKRDIKELQREHFSFSTKILIGEFLKPTGQAENGQEKYLRLNEREMYKDLEVVKKENGWSKGNKKSLSSSSSSSNNKSITKEEKQQQILLETLQQNQKESSDALMHRDAMELLKEAERVERALKEKELKKIQEEAIKQRALENNIKMHEREMKRQQALIIKEQERERRRQHMIFMKLLEGKRRSDERERRREDLRVEKEKDRERRIEQRRLEYEIITELKKPCEDMSLIEEAKPIPNFERMNGMSLSGEAFANVLMIHEFVHNFGDTLGFDVEALPTLPSLQSAMLNDPEFEEELLSIVIHLVVCAIEDPGIPNPNKHLTIMGQSLRQADITNTNITEILKIYLHARAQAEVKACHGAIPPPEFFHQNSSGPIHHLSHYHYYKDKKLREDGPNMEEYSTLFYDTKPYKMSEWVKDKPFLCLNPLEKSEIVAFLCNELLGNKAVMAQVDNNLEGIVHSKKKRWATENKLKKLRMLQQRKFKLNNYSSPIPNATQQHANLPLNNESTTPNPSTPVMPSTPPTSESQNFELETNEVSDKEEDDNMSETSANAENKESAPPSSPLPPPQSSVPKRKGRPPGSKKRKLNSVKPNIQAKKRKSRDTVEEEEKNNKEEEPPENTNEPEKVSEDEEDDDFDDDIGDEEEKMSQDELQKKVDKTLKLLNRRRDELIHTTNRFRASDLGQDRYRRRYWHLAFTDGIFVEGMESAEPWKLETDGMPSEEKRIRLEKIEAEKLEMDSISSSDEDYEDEEEIKKGGEKGKSIAAADLNGIKKEEIKEEKKGSESKKEVLKSHEDIKSEEDDDRSMLKITPNGDKLNLFNHSAQFNMSLSPVVLNGSVTITPKQRDSAGPYPVNSSVSVAISKDSPWFSILPMGKPMLENPSIPSTCEDKTAFSAHQFLHNFHSPSPHIEMLENKLASIKKSDEDKKRVPIPKDVTRGWWRITSTELLRTVEYSLHPRGCREQGLLSNLKKCVEALVHHHYDGSKNPLTIGDEIEFELIEALKSIDENGVPKSDEPGKWNREVALRVEKYILEQVEALEDKVAAASMQVPGWKLPNREDIDERKFRPSCIKEDEIQEYGSLPDAITEAKERLLDLEQNIERRYLKTPLGFGNNEPTLQTITSCRTTMNSSKTPIEENNIENGKNHPDEDENGVESDDENCNKKDSDAPEKEVLPRGLQIWREGVQKAKNAAQLSMGFYVLETSIAWHKSIMKAFCQLCHSGDNEDSLLLCDGCDKGYHMYCFKPSLTNVPEGDWYCFECINKATGIKHCLVCGKQEGRNLISCSQCPRAYHTDCLSPALSKIFNSSGPWKKSPRGKWQCPACQQRVPHSNRKKYAKKAKFIAADSLAITDNEDSKDISDNNQNPSSSPALNDSSASSSAPNNASEESQRPQENSVVQKPPAKKKKYSKIDKDLTACSTLLSELENSEEAWPFLYPVNTKQFPTYRKVIKNPMDIATIKRRLESGIYRVRDDFCNDVRQIFANCEIFNEDDSPVGKAGHAMRTFFETRWAELTNI